MNPDSPTPLSELSATEKRALLIRLKKKAGKRNKFPLSYAQERLWFMEQMRPGGSGYNMPLAVRVEGELAVGVLRKALSEVVRRHEVLRTGFRMEAGQAVQEVREAEELAVAAETLEGVADQEQRLRELMWQEGRRAFDFESGRMIRMKVVKLRAGEHVLLLTMHHIVADAWSLGILVKELGALYAAGVEGRESPLKELPIQYADFAVWQRERLKGEELERQVAYWKEQLAGVPRLELPTDKVRVGAPGYEGSSCQIRIGAGLTQALKAVGREEEGTLFMVLLTAFQILLHRYSGQEDISCGLPIANRNRAETEGLIGFFVNMLVLRVDLRGNPSYRQVLRQVREQTLGAYMHQDVPFEKVVEEVAPERERGENPLFQVTFALQNTPAGVVKLPELSFKPMGDKVTTTRFDLEVHFWEEESGGMNGVFVYAGDLFEEPTVERMVRDFERIAGELVKDADQRIGELELGRRPHREREEYEPGPCLHEIFEEQARERPEAVALSCAGERVSYGELNERANQLAHQLIALGVGADSLVGIYLERSVAMLVGILGVLKAGGAYLPIDLAYPKERVGFMMADGGVKVLLSQADKLGGLPEVEAKIVCLDEAGAAGRSRENPGRRAEAGNLAYVIYTSGSTGKPKGVMVTHYNVVRLFQATRREFEFGPEDSWSFFHSHAFDFSVWEIWGALLYGGKLVVVPYLVSRSPGQFYELLQREEVSVLSQTPSAFRQLMGVVEERGEKAGLKLKWVVFGGEALEMASLKPWFERQGDQQPRLVNMYGITETTVHVTYRALSKADVERGSVIGQAIGDLEVYILDRYGKTAPVGVVGELHVAGTGLARGYLNRADLSGERFVPDPQGGRGGERMYRTGDLGRYLGDGEIEYLGRMDQQVKIRGYRIELGEIESELLGHELVGEAVVVARAGAGGERKLTAYVVPRAGARPELASEKAGEQVAEWQSVFEETYEAVKAVGEAGFNITGWNSSYTGQPIAAEEMREWLEETLGQIRALKPQRVLELGCGTGMILFGIAPESREYWASDFSGTALASIRGQLGKAGLGPEKVKLLQRAANEFAGLEAGYFDLVILNSVAQYFPGPEYLEEVLEKAVKVVRPGGAIFLGDIRSLGLLEAFCVSVQLHQASDTMTLEQLQQRMSLQEAEERELLVGPAFFQELKQRVKEIGQVEILPKRGQWPNELNRFRYQVIVRVGESQAETVGRWLAGKEVSLQTVTQELKQGWPTLGIERLANRGLATEVQSLEWLQKLGPNQRVGELRGKLRKAEGIELEQLRRLGREQGYEMAISWGRHGKAGAYDVVFHQPGRRIAFPEEAGERANDPSRGKLNRQLGPRLREYLQGKLPEYMVPSEYLVLAELPLTANGKVDRKRLPVPDQSRPELAVAYVEARNEGEEKLVKIWKEVLGIERVGVEDNFFELGGHSLLATQVISRVRREYAVEMALRVIFEAPTIGAMARRIEQSQQAGPVENGVIHRLQPRPHPIPLSYAQERLWFMEQMRPGGSGYNMPLAVRVEGELAVGVLRKALSEVVRRHEVLRTGFRMEAGQAVQEVREAEELAVAAETLEGVADQEQRLRELMWQEGRRAFDFESGRMIRMKVVKLRAGEHVLLLTMHHIVADAWSLGILVKELGALYAAGVEGRESPLKELPIQYADFAVWQRERLKGEELERQVAYWKEQLAGVPRLELPTDKVRVGAPGYEGSSCQIRIGAGLTQALKAVGREEEGTLFMVLLTAFQILLHRYSGQEDISCGLPIANRNRAETEGLIGFFVNMLVLRVDLRGNPSYRQVLRQVREQTLGAYMHQDVPFEKVVEEVAPERERGENPLFQVTFALQNTPAGVVKLPELSFKPMGDKVTTTRFDLEVHFWEEESGGMNGVFVYAGDLFEEPTVERMVRDFERIAGELVKDADQRIGELELGRRPHREREEYEPGPCLHEIFEEQARERPEAVALSCAGERVSYGELNERANQLAHQLIALGVGADSLVGIYLERSVAMLVGILGVLKAGGAYLPIDLAYPKERVGFMMADGGVKVLLSQADKLGGLPEVEAKIVCLDEAGAAGRSRENPGRRAEAGNLAYVIYTSGSTGKPKGVMVTHYNVVRLFQATRREFEFGPEDSWSFFHSHAFDFSVWEIWGALLYGGKLVVVPYLVSRSPGQFYELLQREEVSVLSQTPSAFRQLMGVVEERGEKAGLKLKWVVFGGEALEMASLKPWFERQGDQQPRLVNMYGITETTVHVTYRALSKADVERGSVIGQAIGDLEVYILDRYGKTAPVGVVGELHVAGTGLARGYLNRADLSGERFVPDPQGGRGGERMYRTGDLGRYLGDGEIEYLGRMDQQVKIRGYRIELGEIESELLGHELVGEAVVVARPGAGGERKLTAYVVPRVGLAGQSDSRLSGIELRNFLRNSLPEYMVPAELIFLDAIPMTSNGKIDRSKLPESEGAPLERKGLHEAPRSLEEEAMAEIWADVLRVERVGIHDNFFDLGGDSIISLQILSRFRSSGFEISLEQLFQHQTISALAAQIRNVEYDTTGNEIAPFSMVSAEDRLKLPTALEDAYPMTQLQVGMVFHSEYHPETVVYQDIYTYHLELPFDESAIRASIQALSRRHPILRTSFDLNHYSEPLQFVHQHAEISLQVEDVRALSVTEQDEQVTRWMEAEKSHPFPWDEPPLIRFHIYRRSDQSFQLNFTFHHAILDGWSMATMLTELFQHYCHLLGISDKPIDPAPTTLFREFVALERQVLKSVAAQNFWLAHLSDVTHLQLSQPTPGRRIDRPQSTYVPVPLPDQLSDELKTLARKAGVPVKTVLLVAHLKALSFLTSQENVVTGLVSNGRPESIDSEQTLGLFLNTLPFAYRFRQGTWVQVIREVFQIEREMLPHRRFPLPEIQERLGLQTICETAFNFTHFHVYEKMRESGAVKTLGANAFMTANFVLSADFSLDVSTRQINLALIGDLAQLSHEQIKRMGVYYLRVLSAMVAAPSGDHRYCSLLPEHEWTQVVSEWNQTEFINGDVCCVHELFEQRAFIHPDTPAVVFDDQCLNYAEINNRANQLAHLLRKQGVGPEVRVGVYLKREPDAVIAILGVLKAGGVWVPLDPSHPADRIEFVIADSGIKILITSNKLRQTLPQLVLKIVDLDELRPELMIQPSENIPSVAKPSDLAYIVYTSGSTGRPKGVLIEHRGISNFAIWQRTAFRVLKGTRVMQMFSFGFDGGIGELMAALPNGGTLVMANAANLDPQDLAHFINQCGINIWMTVPSLLRQVDSSLISRPEELTIISVGEACPVDLASRWVGKCRFLNGYGPTEYSVAAIVSEVDRLSIESNKTVPIGRPINNTKCYLLDANLNPVPPGAVGEICIAGHGLARGYLNLPEMTAASFMPNPLAPTEDSDAHSRYNRLYKTGDRGRYLPDGSIEFLGRIDHQVKLRGFRIEMGEIEKLLDIHSAIKKSLVIICEDSSGDQRLVAYVVLADPAFETPSLRQYLKEKLPEYMVPSAFIVLDEFPVNASGKIDRQALPSAEISRAQVPTPYVAPRTPVEETLAELWAKVLKLERVGIDDNFFELGGHSLLATQLVSKAREAFQVELPLRNLFEFPTIGTLSPVIEKLFIEKLKRMSEAEAETFLADGKI